MVCAGGGDVLAIVGAVVFGLGAGAPEDGPVFGTKEKGTEVVENKSPEVGLASFAGAVAGVFATRFAGGGGAVGAAGAGVVVVTSGAVVSIFATAARFFL